MKTDVSIYSFLALGPEAFRVLTGGRVLEGPYRFGSVTFKSLERRVDGLFEPDGHAGPVLLVEYQSQALATAGYHLLTEVGLYGEAHPGRDVRGILIIPRARHRPRFPAAAGEVLSILCLDEYLPAWIDREPDNPYVAVLAPLVLRKNVLRTRMAALWQSIHRAPLAEPERATLSTILEFWLIERFHDLTPEEIHAMLNVLLPIEETRAYKEIYARGEAKGEARGKARGKAEGKAEDLSRLLTRRFGPLPAWASTRIQGADIDRLDHWLDRLLDAERLEDVLE
ncbi:DUF2887 domain-containing protein [Thiorhodococcus mannitoliphagus]|uniref:DUF2887 domain-containing protein n=1 Tax=Thiorhodococcus mannitoliphagus TaxID=329406 RepID=A0A6P1E5L8_9GAMM|nr:DUF2887 domain-containing protein [Thiorhodococcus mannitoliphagus]NEX22875.1 DUF2887 domain-containing protein [Thiorhodococcus mannitoliphagus]